MYLTDAVSNYTGLMVCAAGNENSNNDDSLTPTYPANYRLPNLVSAGASNQFNERWVDISSGKGSNYGLLNVDIFAPGEGILSTYPTNKCTGIEHLSSSAHYDIGYHILNGTSFAAPHVAGVAALLLAEYPDMTASELKQTIMDNVTEKSWLADKCVSGGILNAYDALSNPHYHSYSYTSTATTHTATCTDCGYSFTTSHPLTHTSISNRVHSSGCSLCSYTATMSHVMQALIPILVKTVTATTPKNTIFTVMDLTNCAVLYADIQ